MPVSATPFETSDKRIGFTLSNPDRSITLLLQDQFYSQQKMQWAKQPANEGRFEQLVGMLTTSDDEDCIAFTTNESQLLIFDLAGDVLYQADIGKLLSLPGQELLFTVWYCFEYLTHNQQGIETAPHPVLLLVYTDRDHVNQLTDGLAQRFDVAGIPELLN